MVLESIITTTTVSFVGMTITIKDCKSVESMTITVIYLSGYNWNIAISHNIYLITVKGSYQFVSHFKAQ